MQTDRPATVAIIFANLKGNLGDHALLEAAIRAVEEYQPSSRIDIYLHSNRDVLRSAVDDVLARTGSKIRIAGKTAVCPSLNWLWPLRHFIPWRPIQSILVELLYGRYKRQLKQSQRYDLVTLVGGDHFNGSQLGIGMMATVLAFRDHCNRMASLGFSVNPMIYNFSSRRLVRRVMRCLDHPASARDQASSLTLAHAGISTCQAPDSVISLQVGVSNKPRSKTKKSHQPRIALCISVDQGSERRLTARLVEQLVLTNADITWSVITTCFAEDNLWWTSMASSIDRQAPDSWRQFCESVQDCDLLITNRLHGLILASKTDTPTLPICDRAKSAAFASESHCPVTVAQVGDIDRRAIEAALAAAEVTLQRRRAYIDQQSRTSAHSHWPNLTGK